MATETFLSREDHVLIVDDEEVVREAVAEFLTLKGYSVVTAPNAERALEEIRKDHIQLVLTDIKMPGMNGIELLKEIHRKYPGMAVIMMTGFAEIDTAVEAMKLGAYDYIGKPFNFDELFMSISRATEKVDLVRLTREYQHNLEQKVMEQAARIRSLFTEAVTSLTSAIEAKDVYTKGHSVRVTEYTRWILESLTIDSDEKQDIILAAQLHDLGKLGIADEVLNKPGKLTDEEFDLVRQHPLTSARILGAILPQMALDSVRHHHERWDGKGYPDQLSAEDIPYGARVISIADTFDAMTSSRAYRAGLPKEVAFEEIEECSGSQFDPEIVPHFLKHRDRDLPEME